MSADGEESSDRACTSILDAVGNNHAGTYGPSVLPMLEALDTVLRSAGPWSQRAAMEAMIDLFGSFEPEAATEWVGLAGTLRKRIMALEPLVAVIAAHSSVASASAAELVSLMRDIRGDR